MAEQRGALAFDVYGTLVDPQALAGPIEAYLPGEGARVAARWRQIQLDCTFRLAAMGQYLDFREVTRRALLAALAAGGQRLDAPMVDQLTAAYDRLPCLDDVPGGLARLATAGFDLAVLSNGTPAMLEAVLRHAGIRSRFRHVVSVDEVCTYKPAPRVYRHAAERLGRHPDEVCLVSSNQFDVVGATAAGLRAAWIHRPGPEASPEAAWQDPLGTAPEFVVASLDELASALQGMRWRGR